MKRFAATLLLVALAAIASAALYYTTDLGIGLNADSVTYVKLARSLASGHGLSQPSTDGTYDPTGHFPPLYPALLAALPALGGDLLAGARWLNVALFGANVALIGLAVRACTRGSIALSALGALLAATSAGLLWVHAYAWSEAPFITLGGAGLFLLAAYLEAPRRWLLLASGGAIALALLTRYAGAPLVGAGALGLLLLGSGTLRRRVSDMLIFVGLAVAPTVLWLARNALLTGGLTDRVAIYHPIAQQALIDGARTLVGWLLPGRAGQMAPGLVSGLAAGVIALLGPLAGAALVWVARSARLEGRSPRRPLALLLLFLAAYAVFLAASLLFFDANTPLNERILAPVFAAGIVLVLGLGHELLASWRGLAVARLVLLVPGLVLAGSYALGAARYVQLIHAEGQGYTDRIWRDSGLLAFVRSLPAGTPVLTNASDAVYVGAGRLSYNVPRKLDPKTRQANLGLSTDLEKAKARLEAGGVVVYCRRVARWYMLSQAELKRALPLRLLCKLPDGAVFVLDQ